MRTKRRSNYRSTTCIYKNGTMMTMRTTMQRSSRQRSRKSTTHYRRRMCLLESTEFKVRSTERRDSNEMGHTIQTRRQNKTTESTIRSKRIHTKSQHRGHLRSNTSGSYTEDTI
eukprot:2813180-Amphidinium_carterae.2